jgi:hypothetical protein
MFPDFNHLTVKLTMKILIERDRDARVNKWDLIKREVNLLSKKILDKQKR